MITTVNGVMLIVRDAWVAAQAAKFFKHLGPSYGRLAVLQILAAKAKRGKK